VKRKPGLRPPYCCAHAEGSTRRARRPSDKLADDLDTTLPELLERRRLLLDACAVLVDHDLRGICDGPTTVDLAWATTPGIVLDLSALLTQRKALRMS